MKNRNIVEPTVLDLFAGAGGMTEGFRQAGYRSLLAVEYDEMASETFRYNHANVPLITRDIREVSIAEMRERVGLDKGALSLVVGGPPCQGFSLAGQRLDGDPRNQLFKEFVRVVDGFQPEAFVFENVSGILSMSGGSVVKAIEAEFARIGYRVTSQVLNAADFGVPQARPRFIMIGSRDNKVIGFPNRSHAPKDELSDLFNQGLSPHLTVWDALSDLPVISEGEGEEILEHRGERINSYQVARKGERNPGNLYNHRATRHSPRIVERYAAIPQGGDNSQVPEELRTKKINVFKLHQHRPARTVTCNHRTDLLHPTIPRGTTVREAARLQSFDDDYRFFGNLTRKAKWVTQDDQVGNAVPPLLARAIGKHIREVLRW
jgi:DNA (cytosine-5)-methyltransferase 1